MNRTLLSLVALVGWLFFAAPARAQIIKQPGNHPNYAFELEPHLVAQYGDLAYVGGAAGIGLGARAAIPFVQNGPIPKINNNIGISFGLDFVHSGDNHCNGRGYPGFFPDSCSATDLWFPVTAQWNFFLTKIISVFGEVGLSPHYVSWSYDGQCPGGGTCTYHTDHLDFFEPVLWGGGRFMFTRSVGLTVRLGWPYVSAGAAFWF